MKVVVVWLFMGVAMRLVVGMFWGLVQKDVIHFGEQVHEQMVYYDPKGNVI